MQMRRARRLRLHRSLKLFPAEINAPWRLWLGVGTCRSRMPVGLAGVGQGYESSIAALRSASLAMTDGVRN